LDAQGGYHFLGSGGGGGGGYGLNLKPGATVSLSFLLGVLNSRLLDWLVKLSNSRFHGDYFSFNRQYIEPLPIRPIDFTNKADARLYAGIASAAEELSRLCGQAALASTEHAQTLLVREIETLDRQVNEFVYTLYGLTDEEQRIVEPERTKRK
jgi:hypothetical protein